MVPPMPGPYPDGVPHGPEQPPSHQPAQAGGLGKDELLAVLMQRRGAFLAFVKRRLRSGADAEDVLQQALLRAVEKAHTLRDSSLAEAWFYRVLRTVLADHHARWALRQSKLEQLLPEAEAGAPEEVAVCACALGLLPQLKEEYAAILERVDLGDEALADAASALGISANNAAVRLHRARKALRDGLQRCCGMNSLRGAFDCACAAEGEVTGGVGEPGTP